MKTIIVSHDRKWYYVVKDSYEGEYNRWVAMDIDENGNFWVMDDSEYEPDKYTVEDVPDDDPLIERYDLSLTWPPITKQKVTSTKVTLDALPPKSD